MKDRIAKSVFWMVWSKGGIQTISFVTTIFVVRWLSPSDYGLMALAGVWVSVISIIAELGLGSAIIQFQDLDERELNACFWVAMSLAVVCYGGMFLAAPFIGEWFESPQLPLILEVSSLSIVFVALRTVPDSLLRKNLLLDKVSQAESVASVVTVPLVLVLAWAGVGVWALVVGAVSTPCIQTIASFYFLRWSPGFSVRGERLLPILNFSVTSIGSRLCWALYSQADTFVLGKVAGETMVGLYSMGKQIATLAVNKISTVANQLATPVMAGLQSDRSAMRQATRKCVRLVATATFPMCVGLMILADDCVRVLLTDKWVGVIPLLQVLCGYAMIRSVDVLFPPVLYARYRAPFLLWYGVVLVVCMPIAFYIGALTMGGFGVALAWIVVYPFIVFKMVDEALQELHFGWHDLWCEVKEPVLLSALMGCAVYPVSHWIPGLQSTPSWVHLISMILFGAAVYVAAIVYRGGQLKQDMDLLILWVTRSSP